MDRESKSSLDNPATKKKPPKLKAINRSISMAIDNYTPAPQMIIDNSLIFEESPLAPPPPQALVPSPPAPLLTLPLAKFPQPDIYLVSGGGSTSPIKYDDWHPMKKPLFRRSDTIDIHPSSTLQMKKTHSFHANDPTMEQIMLQNAAGSASSSRRTSSVRGAYLFPQPSTKEISRSPSPSRRGCRTHRSFNEPSRRPSVKTEADAIRHPSLNDDILESNRPPPLFSTTNLSLENELFISSNNRSRSNSHTKIEDQRLSFEETAIAGSSTSINSRKQHARQHSSQSLELEKHNEVQQHHNHHLLPSASISPSQQQPGQSHPYHFKRGGKHTHSLYLSPNNLEELQIHRPAIVQQGATKKLHSASVRVRTYREALSASKKSKSFMGDAYPDFDLSPHRRNSRPLTTVSGEVGPGGVNVDDIKRSPRPLVATTSGRLLEEKRPSFERKASLPYEVVDAAAFDQVLRPFRHPTRRSSMTGSAHKLKKKSLSDDTDEDEESDRKRKRIVCIIMTVFLCLACASVFVVIITLTHSSVAQGQNTTKKIYTFSRETPVHYTGMTIRQENERLMQESINRARFAKNFTDAASLAATAEQIP